MTYDPNNRRRARGDGMSGGMIAFLAVAAVLVLGALFMMFAGDNTNTASNTSPGTTQTAPATTGQGGAQSKMPQKSAP
jgi:hypothetical protein